MCPTMLRYNRADDDNVHAEVGVDDGDDDDDGDEDDDHELVKNEPRLVSTRNCATAAT